MKIFVSLVIAAMSLTATAYAGGVWEIKCSHKDEVILLSPSKKRAIFPNGLVKIPVKKYTKGACTDCHTFVVEQELYDEKYQVIIETKNDGSKIVGESRLPDGEKVEGYPVALTCERL